MRRQFFFTSDTETILYLEIEYLKTNEKEQSQKHENSYTNKCMKQKLEEKYDEKVIIFHETGKFNIETIRETVDSILRDC